MSHFDNGIGDGLPKTILYTEADASRVVWWCHNYILKTFLKYKLYRLYDKLLKKYYLL